MPFRNDTLSFIYYIHYIYEYPTMLGDIHILPPFFDGSGIPPCLKLPLRPNRGLADPW